MFRLAWIVMPYALLVISPLMLLIGVGTLAGEQETAPTAMTAGELPRPGNGPSWVRLKGYTRGDEVLTQYEERAGKETKITGYLVPVLSEQQALSATNRWADAGRVVYAAFTPEQFESRFGDGSSIGATRIEVEGTVAAATFLDIPLKGRELLQRENGLRLDQITMLKVDGKPLQAGDAVGIIVLSVLMGIGGVLWVRRRRHHRQAAAVVASSAGAALVGLITEKILDNIDA